MRIAAWALCLALFAAAFLGVAREAFDETSVIAALTFTIVYLLMARVYGGFDIGTRSSRAIALSSTVAALFSDIAAHLFLCILHASAAGRGFAYERPLLLLGVFAAQLITVTGMAYLGNGFYFSVKSPQRGLVIAPEGADHGAWLRKLGAYKKRFSIEESACPGEPELMEKLERADAVFLYDIPPGERAGITELCYRLKKDLYYGMELSDVVAFGAKQAYFDDTALVFAEAEKIPVEAETVKRAMDIVLSCLGLAAASPLLLITAAAIKIEDGGPVFYRQKRVTRDGRVFEIVKFRSMRPEVGGIHRSVTEGDDRITKTGRVIRRFRIDELPQFWNVLRGDMSLVGPRPEMLENVEKYTAALPAFDLRLRVKAGMTGLAQIYGKYNTTPRDKLTFDLLYIENFSLWLDIKILLRTVIVLLTPGRSTAAFGEDGEK